MSGRGGRRGAFTLVECLGAVVLLALAFGVVAAPLGPTTAAARTERAALAVLESDALARSLARAGEPATLALRDGRVEVWVARSGAAERVATRDLGRAVEVSLSHSGPRAETIDFDALGRSEDYLISARAGGRRVRLLVAGLTGWSRPAGGER